jgi:hypothetical protein
MRGPNASSSATAIIRHQYDLETNALHTNQYAVARVRDGVMFTGQRVLFVDPFQAPTHKRQIGAGIYLLLRLPSPDLHGHVSLAGSRIGRHGCAGVLLRGVCISGWIARARYPSNRSLGHRVDTRKLDLSKQQQDCHYGHPLANSTSMGANEDEGPTTVSSAAAPWLSHQPSSL